MKKRSWLLFDFGGCLDSDGIHSRTLFYQEFLKAGVITPTEDQGLFQDAYTYSDRLVIDHSLIKEANLLEMNEVMCQHIAEALKRELPPALAQNISERQGYYLKRNASILKNLSNHYKMGVVSNFSGNLNIILKEFELESYFCFVLDSYHVGLVKPDPALFKMAVGLTHGDASDIYFIGDNLERDIIPAAKAQMGTVHINSQHSSLQSLADYTFSSIKELETQLLK